MDQNLKNKIGKTALSVQAAFNSLQVALADLNELNQIIIFQEAQERKEAQATKPAPSGPP
jgi:hypothetical protein